MFRLGLKVLLGMFVLAALLVTYEYLNMPDVAKLKNTNPTPTALMQIRDEQLLRKGLKPLRKQVWVPYGDFSDALKRAVILGEDAGFFSHQGVDLFELKEAVKEDLERGRFKRGASTITMQLARNLYLSPEKSLLRKLREIMIAFEMERVLSKQRIMEIYLNVAEWGPGLYGAEAAAQHYFSKPALSLTAGEAATLAALLPSPRGSKNRDLMRRRNTILKRMLSTGAVSASEFEQIKDQPAFPEANGNHNADAG
jgi:monofunctional biosynthetic peptidoglycan transglycosylase